MIDPAPLDPEVDLTTVAEDVVYVDLAGIVRQGPLTGPEGGRGAITPDEHADLAQKEWLERIDQREQADPFPGEIKQEETK